MLDPEAPSTAIIAHPDVRRMLMHMKAHVDGMRSFIYYVGRCFDRMETAADDDTRAEAKGLIDVLTPVVKAYCTDRAFDVCTLAVQTFGGYGYTCEYPVEQYLRDCKITSIYEGTNGIQAMDLLGRKLGLAGGKFFMALLAEMQQTVAAARRVPLLAETGRCGRGGRQPPGRGGPRPGPGRHGRAGARRICRRRAVSRRGRRHDPGLDASVAGHGRGTAPGKTLRRPRCPAAPG